MKRKLDVHDVPKPVPGESAGGDGFETLGLDARLLQAVAREGFSKPTSIQAQAIPLALQGKDIVARAYTGSGKTAAYLLPLLQSILQQKKARHDAKKAVLALILVPTQELAQQVHKVTQSFCAFCARDIRALNLSQKASEVARRSFLEDVPDVVVATPAAVHAGLRESTLQLEELLHVVIDEADLVLSYGYEEDLAQISRAIPDAAQKVLTSATMASEVDSLKVMFCQDPVVLEVDETPEESDRVQQYIVDCGEAEKFVLLYVIFKLKLIKGKCIIFVDNVDRCYRLKLFLEQFGIRSCILNPELPVNSRLHTVDEFNKNVYDIIIGSDEHEVLGEGAGVPLTDAPARKKHRRPKSAGSNAARREFGIARGLDFRHVACVFNFDLPASAASYAHRIGRTARAGATGLAFSFAVPAHEHGRHRPTTVAAGARDPAVRTAIAAAQQAAGRQLLPYAFDDAQVAPFHYRARDALRAVTRAAVRAARTAELRAALLHSQALQRHFEENPDDLRHLRRDGELRAARVQPHLRHVPDYLLPSGGGGGARAAAGDATVSGTGGGGGRGVTGLVALGGVSDENARRKQRAVHRARKQGKARRADPLRTFNARGRGKK